VGGGRLGVCVRVVEWGAGQVNVCGRGGRTGGFVEEPDVTKFVSHDHTRRLICAPNAAGSTALCARVGILDSSSLSYKREHVCFCLSLSSYTKLQ